MTTDELIAALHERVADPARRTSARRGGMVMGAGPGGAATTFAMGDLLSHFGGLLDAARTGKPFDLSQMRAAEPELPAPISADALASVELELGSPLPLVLRRAYLEVANGGFGWGQGLYPLEDALKKYRELRRSPPAPRDCEWPEGMLPLVENDPGYVCVDVRSGRVIEWDPEELTERSSKRRWERSFSEVAPTVDKWLEDWIPTETMEQIVQRAMPAAMAEVAKRMGISTASSTPPAKGPPAKPN